MGEYIPDFKLDLLDLSKTDLDKLESVTLRVILGVIQRIWEGDDEFLGHLGELLELLGSLQNESKRVEILKKLFLYIYNVREIQPQEISKVLNRSKLEKYEDLSMTTAEKLREEGKIEGKIETARNMFSEGLKLEVILRITGLSEKDLKDRGIT